MGAKVEGHPEGARHDAAISSLVRETHRPESEIRTLYEQELVRLENGARVRDYLHICAIRHIRETLRHRP